VANFKKLNGKSANVNVSKYKVDWTDGSLSKIQRKIKDFLFQYWKGHMVYEELPVAGTRMRLDFLNMTNNIAIEVDGDQHTNPLNYFNEGSKIKWLGQVKRDLEKDRWCELNEFTLVRINESEINDINKAWFKTKYDIDL
jgi:hypothetical protein